jgi:hypothetical protein
MTDAIRKVCASKGITLDLARQAFANCEEKANIARAKHAEAEHEAAFWHRILLELQDE